MNSKLNRFVRLGKDPVSSSEKNNVVYKFTRVEKFHGSLLSDSMEVLVWLRSGAGQHSMTKKLVYVANEIFFYKFRKIHKLVTSF